MLTHLSIVGSLVFFYATAGFRERVLSSRRSLGLKPPAPAAYVSHLQEMITHGLATSAAALEGAGHPPTPRLPERARHVQRTRRA